MKLNVEMAATPEMTGIAARIRPDQVTLVPEREGELTTEGGLDVVAHRDAVELWPCTICVRRACASASSSIQMSGRWAVSRACGAEAAEINTEPLHRRRRSLRASPSRPRGRRGARRRRTRTRGRLAGTASTYVNVLADRGRPRDRRAQHRSQHRCSRRARWPRARSPRDGRVAAAVMDRPRHAGNSQVSQHVAAHRASRLRRCASWVVHFCGQLERAPVHCGRRERRPAPSRCTRHRLVAHREFQDNGWD